MRYRADIDGLRSFAILPIVLFHMGFTQIAGGYVGVDVFFVISGFLITGLINRDLEQGRFSFAAFYQRRVRRLFPALAVTLAVTVTAGFFLLFKTHFNDAAGSAFAALLSWSNIYFWMSADYFDSDAILKPLLHTWSLAVEEQFYFVWPGAMFLMHRFAPRSMFVLMVLVGVASMVVAQIAMQQHASTAFYLMPFRVCEFAIGGICALLPRFRSRQIVADVLSIAGLAGIVIVSIAYSEQTAFPGFNSVWPCVATAAVIMAGPRAAGNRLIALNPFRYIGRISYSLYLVHWPIIVFYAYYFNMPRDVWTVVVLTFAAIALGALLYHAVEVPTRAKTEQGYLIGSRVFGGSAAAIALASIVFFVAGWSGLIERKLPAQFERLVKQLDEGKDVNKIMTRFARCHASAKTESQYLLDWEKCSSNEGSKIAIVGDSHAGDLWGAVNTAYPGLDPLQFTGGGCGWVAHAKPTANCVYLRRHLNKWFALKGNTVTAIIYTQRGRHFVFQRPEDLVRLKLDKKNIRSLRKQLEKLEAETGVPVYFWGPRPELHPGPDLQLARSSDFADLQRRLKNSRWKAYVLIDTALQKEFQNSSVTYISAAQALCASGGCDYLTDKGMFVSYDPAHWTREGAQFVVSKVVNKNPRLNELFAAGGAKQK